MQLLNLNNAYFLKQNDTATQIQMKVVEFDGLTPIALDDFVSLEVVIGTEFGRLVAKTPTLLAETGAFEFGLDEGDILPSGTQRLEFHMISENGERRVAPSKGFYKMKVEQGIDEFQAVITTVTLQLALDSIEEQSTNLQGQYDEFVSVAQPLVDASVGAVTDAEIALGLAGQSLATSQQVLVDVGDTIPLAQEATLNANTSATEADSARSTLTGAVGGALSSLASDKAETIAEMDAKIAETEVTRSATEAVRVTTEAERLATATVRAQTSDTRNQTETERLAMATVRADTIAVKNATEAERVATASERGATASERALTTAERLATTAERQSLASYKNGIDTRVATVETKATSAETIANLAKARADQIIAGSGVGNAEQIDSRLGADLIARNDVGTLIREIHTQQLETARQTTTLGNGVAVVTGGVDTLAETEIEGRTLISLANSNLDATKQYVIADKKTKVIVDGITQSGVAKFTKGTTTVSTANFLNKVSGSNVANPHVIKYSSAGVLTNAPSFSSEGNQGFYDNAKALNGTSAILNVSSLNGIAQVLFSFDVIAEIERKLGIIPKSTVAEKVQWVKDNVEGFASTWHGFGSSVGGNKATFKYWDSVANAWAGALTKNHTNPTVTSIVNGILPIVIDANGFVHTLAYADASDGITASSISTDYIDLVVTLKSTAQLNTRPTIIRVENFEGKVSGSVVENGHVAKYRGSATLNSPNSFTAENTQVQYDKLKTLDGSPFLVAQSVNGDISQQLFSFNLIEAIERNVGKIPRTSVADKVQWLKDNVAKLTANWHGFGSSVGGNKASTAIWSNSWNLLNFSTSATVIKLAFPASKALPTFIQADGFVHYLAYADASDGVIASTINTDYIDLEIELKPTADFTRPKVALYEVTADSYAKILVDWSAEDVINRYPSVEGVQHLQGVGVIAEGENLLPPMYEAITSQHANTVILSNYEVETNATVTQQNSIIRRKILPNQTVTFSYEGNGGIGFYTYDSNGGASVPAQAIYAGASRTFTTSATAIELSIYLITNATGKNTWKNLMLNLGTTAKPFVPRNPSYLFADVKLGAIGTVADRLYEQDGAKFVRKAIEKDVVLDGSITWAPSANFSGYKSTYTTSYTHTGVGSVINLIKHDGKVLKKDLQTTIALMQGSDTSITASTSTGISIPNVDTGFTDVFSPFANDWKRYFNGWKYIDGTTWTSVTGNGQTATAQVALDTKPTDYTPYKLSYVLATPQIVNVTDKVEGSLKVNGLTQVEALSGIVRREKVNPVLNSAVYHINLTSLTAPLKNRVLKITEVYKNGIKDTGKWVKTSTAISNAPLIGNERAYILPADFDPTAEYTVTYIALDKPLLTANPTNIKLLYANNMRSALEDTVTKVQDGLTQLSVLEKSMVDLYVKVRALEAK